MKIGIIGLGKMGYPIALNLKDKGYEPVAFNRSPEKIDKIRNEGVEGAYTLEDLASKLDDRKIIFMMLPAGDPIDDTIESLLPYLSNNDILIDGGNSHYKDTKRRYEILKIKNINYVDVGTSGGVDGARNGACMMVGGDEEAVGYLEQVFIDICVPDGYAHVGPSGSGHYVKMIHNGIEYGMMQAIGEGFEVMSESEYDIDYMQVARLWQQGSVIRGWLMELTEKVFIEHEDNLEDIIGVVNASGEGRWTVEEALELNVPVPVIASSLFTRYRSQQSDTFSGKLLAGLRFQFGGHKMERK
ncbi:phosphogluconate dehydrogenase (NAD(+)-dependent, decarboxylating) [Alkalibacter mobilis]|uniref:phosphogluconate dehydrogenase (NAD(+)-dependent, decarboxylating) n=1 Tax=Alkalibacter mobilis TaxID=2787712 RepID=UPI00189F113F|nr:decarboxylating 6-phosphogluconate dehydrogenase [Alkalibacter mobilis]MBF7095735.1 decarboxylating 6-phosphogluconate dehydrogenase [Alkalibacter mobilis]